VTDIYLSSLLDVTDPNDTYLELLVDQLAILEGPLLQVEVNHFTAENELIAVILPDSSLLENNIEGKTKISVFLPEGRVSVGDKLQVAVRR
jgi:hypothetical protein